MFSSFKHKGLRSFSETGDLSNIQAKHAKRLRLILGFLDAAVSPRDMNFPGFDLHPLKGDKKGYWAVKVSGNWRVTFRFHNGDAYDVDYLDYH